LFKEGFSERNRLGRLRPYYLKRNALIMSNDNAIAEGKVVSIHYTLTTENDELIDSTEGGDPYTYLHGSGNVIEGLEANLLGHAAGDKVHAVVPPEQGYGERMDTDIVAVPRDNFPSDAEIQPGVMFNTEDEEGKVIALWVVGLEDDSVLLELNHPLAGKSLTFDVEVIDVRDATDEEKTHGHVHDPGDHAH
jgi:FKBP-type peptidyl-prolyl cis-trans isomerase SlyD